MGPDTGIEKGPQAGKGHSPGTRHCDTARLPGGWVPDRVAKGKPLQAEMFLFTTSCQSSILSRSARANF
jgi:hypothetical protein